MIATECDGQNALLCMAADCLCHLLTHSGHQPRVLQLANVGIADDGVGNILELMVTIEVDFPAEFFELLGQAGFDEMDGTLIDAWAGLSVV